VLKTGDAAAIAACGRGWRRILGMRARARTAGTIREEATT